MNFNPLSNTQATLKTTRVVLLEPFIRHAAGHVFELHANTTVSGWDEDDRARERLNLSGKSAYFLPDGGNGRGAELRVNMTKSCPPEVFEGVDLRSGPCRVTGSTFGADANPAMAEVSPLKYQARLLEINGLNAQGIEIELERQPRKIVLNDALRSETLHPVSAESSHLTLDFSSLLPGFYQLVITTAEGAFYFVQVFKAFPLLVIFEGRSERFSTQKTLY